MSKEKLESLNAEIEKIRQKLEKYQNKLNELTKRKTELENLMIVENIRAICLTPEELNKFLKEKKMPDKSEEN